MKRGVRLVLAAATLTAAVALAVPQGMAAADTTPLWVKHVLNYPGGLSNAVRAQVDPDVIAAQGAYANAPLAPAPPGDLNNLQMNADSEPPLPQNETSVAYSLDDPMIAVAGANDYVQGGLALMNTSDGGQSWNTFFQAPQFFPFRENCRGGDPSIAYSLRDHAFYASTLCSFVTLPQSELQVWKSVDNGQTWTPNRLGSVAASNYNYETGETDTSIFLDKELITIDNNPGSPFFGRIYMTYVKFHFDETGFSDYCPVQLSYTDEIPTENPQLAVWQHTAVVPDNPGDDGIGESANQWAIPEVEADGDLDISYALEDCNTGLDRELKFQKSTDGGDSFLASPIRIDKPGQFVDNPDLGDILPPTRFRAPLSPSLDVNKATGTLAFVYQNNVFRGRSGADISLQLSYDGGFTWTDMEIISTGGGGKPARNDQFFPWIDSDQAGNYWVIWFDRRRDPGNKLIDTFQAESHDDGASWINYRISTESWNPNRGFFGTGTFIGDYNGLAAHNDVLYPVWTDGRQNAGNNTGIGETDIWTNVTIQT